MDVTIVIQGPLHENGINNSANYLKYGPVIFSCWDSCDISKISGKFSIIINKIPNKKFYNNSNIFFQSFTSYNGIKEARTKFVIKVRCDEAYSDLGHFIDIMQKNPECMTTNDIFFRPDYFMKFHPSDHVIGGRTDYLTNTFGTLVEECQTKVHLFKDRNKLWKFLTKHEQWTRPELSPVPEILIATRFLMAKGVPIIAEESVRIMQENFKLVRTLKMGKFIVSANGVREATTKKDLLELGMVTVCGIIKML